MNTKSHFLLARSASAGLILQLRPNHRQAASVLVTLAWAAATRYDVSMCRADYVSQCNAADWRKRRRPAPRRDPVETADGKFLLLYVIAIVPSLFFVTKFALGL